MEPWERANALRKKITDLVAEAQQQNIQMRVQWGKNNSPHWDEDSVETDRFWSHSWC